MKAISPININLTLAVRWRFEFRISFHAVELFQLRVYVLLQAVWANSMRKFSVRVLGNVGFQLQPVVFVVADLLAVGTDG